MEDDHRDGVFFSPEDQDYDENWTAQIQTDNQQQIFPIISMEEAAACYSDYMLISDNLSTFGVINPPVGSIPCSKEEITSANKGQSSGAKRKHVPRADSLKMKRKLEIDGDGVGDEQYEAGCDCTGQKRSRSSEVHNLKERLRRQKLQEKMKALRELIPNCDKRDKGHVLDEAMKYIKTLQNQVQMMSMGAGFSMFHSPFMMPQTGMQIPTLPQFPPTDEYGIGIGTMGMGMGMGIPGLHSMMNVPMMHFGLCASTSSSSTAQSIQNYLGNYVMPPWNGISFPTPVSQCTTTSAQGAPKSWNEFCPIPEIGEVRSPSSSPSGLTGFRPQNQPVNGCSTRRGSKAKVLPSQIIRPHVNRELKDYGCSESRSSEWDTSNSFAKSEGCS